jgi:alpha-glucosidase/oligosaccharide 4-alpha-D-glucosyltransferase
MIQAFVRAGAFVPMAKVVQTTRDYSSRSIDLHYYHDASVATARGKLYDDDGEPAGSYEHGKYEIVRFASSLGDGRLEIRFDTETGQHYRPAARIFALKVHRVATRPRALTVDGRGAPFRWDAGGKLLEVGVPLKPGQPKKVVVAL